MKAISTTKLFASFILLQQLTACTKIEKPIACIDASDTAYYNSYFSSELYLTNSCSKGAFLSEWTLPDNTKVKADKINIANFYTAGTGGEFKLKVTSKDGKQSDETSFIYSPKLKLPQNYVGMEFYDSQYLYTCDLSSYVEIATNSSGVGYDFYLRNSSNSSKRLGAVLTEVSNLPPNFFIEFTIPSQTLGGNTNITGSGRLYYSSQNYPFYHYLEFTLSGINGSCYSYYGRY